jgi:hypothetical protein
MFGLIRNVTLSLRNVAAVAAVLMLSSHQAVAALGDIDTAYIVVSDTATSTDCGGGQCFIAYQLNEAGTTVSGDSVTLGPNYTWYAAGDAFWADGASGNKKVLANSFGEQVGVPVGTGTVKIDGYIDSNTLDSSYTVLAFVKLLDPNNGYADIVGKRLAITGGGKFSLEADLTAYEGDTALIIQTGFEVTGVNGNPANAGALGSIALRLGATGVSGGPGADVEGIPVLPLWALFGLAGLIGLMGLRRKA